MTPVALEGDVICRRCGENMDPIIYRDIEHRARWLFWRCRNDTQHITRAVPLPVGMWP